MEQGLFSGARTRDSRAVFKILALKLFGREEFSRSFQNSRAQTFRAREFCLRRYIHAVTLGIHILKLFH